MSKYSFRFRFVKSPKQNIGINSNVLQLASSDVSEILTLCSLDSNHNILNSQDLVLNGSGWFTEEEAKIAGRQYQDALLLSFACIGIGIDFGVRASSKSFITQKGLEELQQTFEQRNLNDSLGLTVYESEPVPHFISSECSISEYVSQDCFEKYFTYIISNPYEITIKARLSLSFFHASFFQQSIDARFLLLVTAIEALIETRPRSNEAVNHVENLIKLTRDSESLTQQDRCSLITSLGKLREQSIGKLGRELAATTLKGYTYKNLSPSNFFQRCYDIRSRLVHGSTPSPPVFSEVGEFVVPLKKFVSDLLIISCVTHGDSLISK